MYDASSSVLHDTIVVGAGPAGLGVASTLQRIGIRATVVDRYGIGASFNRWPEGMRLITPSFTGNQFGLVDLNAITPDTSPALSLVDEHPTGEAYAAYLAMVAELDDLDVRPGIEVTDVRPAASGHLAVHVVGHEPWLARTVVWAAGELQYPLHGGFPGAQHNVPTVTVDRWAAQAGPRVVVIGGYESGIDAAVNLVERGRKVTVIDRVAPWDAIDADPSRTRAEGTDPAALDLHLLRGRTFLAWPTWAATRQEARSTLSHVTLRALPIFVGITVLASLSAAFGAGEAIARGLGPRNCWRRWCWRARWCRAW